MRKSTWDKSKGYRMWTEGASDAEIGRACGAATSTVRFCRLKHWEGKLELVMERAEDALSGGGLDMNHDAEQTVAAVKEERTTVAAETRTPVLPVDGHTHNGSTPRGPGDVSLMDVIEAATEGLRGIQAVCTANILQALWNWSCREDLEAARESIEYLLNRMEG